MRCTRTSTKPKADGMNTTDINDSEIFDGFFRVRTGVTGMAKLNLMTE